MGWWGGGMVAHVILVSAQVLLVLTLCPWTLDFGLGLDNIVRHGLAMETQILRKPIFHIYGMKMDNVECDLSEHLM